MSRLSKSIVLAGLLAWFVPSPVAGQVAPLQGGRELDADYRIGGRGINTPVPSSWSPTSSQLYVNGQVTGLGRFRGGVGYYAANSLRLDVPSARLSRFQQQSVGLQDAVGGRSYVASPFYSRTSTVVSAAGIAAGRALPGSNIPRTSSTAAFVPDKLFIDATRRYQPLGPIARPVMSTIDRVTRLPGPIEAGGGLGGAMWRDATWSRYSRPGTTGMFGGPQVGERSIFDVRRDKVSLLAEGGLPRVPRALDGAGAGTLPDKRPAATAVPTSPAPLPGKAGSQAPRPGGGLGAPLAGGAGQKPGGVADPRARLDPARKGQVSRRYRPARNQDVFTDVLVGLHEKWSSPVLGGRRRGGAAGKSALAAGQGATNYVQLTGDRRMVVRALAGDGADSLNRRMAAARGKLRGGQYYRAAAHYERAAVIGALNPLPRIGAGLSLFCAGEPLRAAGQIRRAVQDFPPIMETQLDVRGIVGGDVFGRRIERLDRRLAGTPGDNQGELTFLAAFLHFNAGDGFPARIYAGKLKRLAGDDTFLRAYAEYVLTGKRPLRQKQQDKK